MVPKGTQIAAYPVLSPHTCICFVADGTVFIIIICQYKIKVSAQQMKDAIINVLVKGILDSVSLHSHEEETPIDGEQPGPSGINPLSTLQTHPLSLHTVDGTKGNTNCSISSPLHPYMYMLCCRWHSFHHYHLLSFSSEIQDMF
jgi:hypothetical protein